MVEDKQTVTYDYRLAALPMIVSSGHPQGCQCHNQPVPSNLQTETHQKGVTKMQKPTEP